MKKILFATTALVATAGYAAADITVSGGANMGVKYLEDRAGGETYTYTELDFGINASGTTDSGIEFGASIDLDATDSDGSAKNDNAALDPETYISSGGLTLRMGNLDGVSDPFGLPDIGFDGIGVDDVAEKVTVGGTQYGVKADASVSVEYAFGDYTFVAAANEDDDWGVSFAGAVDAFTFGIAYEEVNDVQNTGIDGATTWLNLGYSFGAFGVDAFYVNMDPDGFDTEEGYGLAGSYTAGDLTVTAVWADNSTADDAAYGIDAAYDLGSGLVVKGGVGSVNDKTAADFGVIMSF
ncbi:Porin [Pseudooceanicola marinus]|uniref:Porin n=1 Tax=Pseudooceanicola marinus TaxID=396013 RepID=A0A1X7A3W2_9RHOB|nr:porin [Pseudooceanicola marinus]PJE31135.1 porin [Pseudooceanicola marinus]SLN69429.1 Porin [Pseudooceanicola marinus]